MPLDGGRPRIIEEAVAGTRAIAHQTMSVWSRASPFIVAIGSRSRRVVSSLPIVRFFQRSIVRRIVLSNLVGLAILLLGYFYLSQYKDWLVDAKVDSLTAQGEIIAQAIAGNATRDGERLLIDPEVPPEGPLPGAAQNGAFTTLTFSIGPERVTPILRRMIQPDIRARVYDNGGRLITDTADFLPGAKQVRRTDADEKPRTKNFWTRLTEYFFASDLPVLRELDRANGNYYPPVRSAMAGSGTPMLLLNEEGQQIVSYAAPITRSKQILGVLLLSTDPGEIDKVLTKERNAIWKLFGLAVVTSVVVSILLAWSVAGPIHRLSEGAKAVSRDINARHALPDFATRQDEVAQLAQSFHAMTASLFRRIEASEKFAADVAHELKNPLTAANATAQALSYARTEEEREQLVAQIRGELKRLNRLISDVSNASRLDAELALQQREPVNTVEVLENVVATFHDILGGTSCGIVLEIDGCLPSSLVVQGQEGRLGQVVTNLIDNAISFSPPDSTVRVRARRDGEWVEIAVEDEGPGIEPDKLETVFDRFYTYRPTANTSRGNNSGLGLSISREIVRAHQGTIWAENRYAPGVETLSREDRSRIGANQPPRLGARFVMRLPAARTPRTASTSMLGWRV